MSSVSATVPTLSDGIVTLRGHTLADAPAITEQCTDPEMLRWTTVPRGYTLDQAVARVEQTCKDWADPFGARQWAIEIDRDGAPAYGGSIDLRPGATPTTSSLGFGLHPEARGQGVMARAVRLVAAHAFSAEPWGRPVTRLHWRAVVGNWGSRRVAWATGFTFHGTLPESHVDSNDPEGPALDTWQASLGRGDAMSPRHPWLTAPVLELDGIRLRPWRVDDIDAIENRENDPVHWMPAHAVLRRETFEGWRRRRFELMSEGASVEWCVADTATDRALGGMVVFSRWGPIGDTAELGYQLFPSARGRGAAKTGARLAIRHALTPLSEGGLGLRRMVGETAADNAASNRVLESNGFVAFGREHRVDELAGGGWGDGLHWELLPDTEHGRPSVVPG
ncbi:GCN5 family acetyltransferase [Humibacillus sp. DSM 29435]|uniref:GNAT family N-acetyltransferase n=1 Tax=Humibacillus sp. DSM 29435 TaxID=1869167 RepID=UPI0008727ED1|nr:GNAT family N-acetyltransferase [Humibacillus sp. DSM 29435]OFE19073.1 GCN5 family acetyltransferase [Humibacillus sp. DSM 29435]